MVRGIDKTITRDFVLENLIKNKIVLNRDIHDLPHEANQFIKTQITKFNNKYFKEQMTDEFEKLNKGTYNYSLSFRVRVRKNVDGRVTYFNKDTSAEFKDDRKKEDIPKKQFYT